MTAMIEKICLKEFQKLPEQIQRYGTGQGNYVYRIDFADNSYILRCSPEPEAYRTTAHLLGELLKYDLPVPQVLAQGQEEGFDYLLLSCIEGSDLGDIYKELTSEEKRLIAQELVRIQKKIASLPFRPSIEGWTWHSFIRDMLDRAETRIRQNGHFDPEKVKRLRQESWKLDSYFSAIPPLPYLDDISNKNLLIHQGRLSGIVDVDEMGFGDPLTYVALTNMALLNEDCDTDYVDFLLTEMRPSPIEKLAFLFYTLIYCVDFMGERGMTFLDKQIPVSQSIIQKLNRIYEALWKQWLDQNTKRVYFLTTERMGFSHWEEKDLELARLLWGDPQVTKYICASGVFSDEDIARRLQTEIQNESRYHVQYWPIFRLDSGELIGCCGLRPHGESCYELGFHLRPAFWGKGYAVEAATAVIDYTFRKLGATSLFAGHNPKNIPSRKRLLSLGFIYSGDEFYEPTGLYHPSYELKPKEI